MKIKSQIAMVLNLDKCLSCHACSVVCKNAWTTGAGKEYMWFNNVETKPGLGYPRDWENQKKYKGGWDCKNGSLGLKSGGKLEKYLNIFASPNMPELDAYAEPWTYDYEKLTNSPSNKHQPVARPVSAITGKPMEPQWGSNWEDDLGGVSESGNADYNFTGLSSQSYLDFQRVFMLHLPRICEHCLHPACVAACPSGAMYKREEDGIVLADQTRCRGWRHCVSGCPYKKTYFNWKEHRAEKCLMCYPRVENGQPTLCSHSCVGRIRYMGVILYDADKVREAASSSLGDLYASQLALFLDPHNPEVRKEALGSGIHEKVLEAASRSPVYKLISEWKLALPLHPEFRTLPMVWYIPPASPLVDAGHDAVDVRNMRIPLRYIANLLTAGDIIPVQNSLNKLIAMRKHMRELQFGAHQPELLSTLADAPDHTGLLAKAGLTPAQAKEMYELLAIARYENRFVLPSAGRENAINAFAHRGKAGFPASEETL